MSSGSGSSDVGHTPADEIDPGRRETSGEPAVGESGPEPTEPQHGIDVGADQAPQTGATRNMLPGRERRAFGLERLFMRLVATCGVVAIGVALGAILVSSDVQGWITGLVVSGVSVALSAVLWSSRQL